jgi:hypothetical protein
MKKFLLGTTALIGAATLFASAAHAEGPAVTLGGFVDFQAGYVDQDLDATGTVGGRDLKFQNDTEVHVKVDGKADNGLGYGAVIELEADVTADNDGEGLNADKTYLFLESNFGRVELGNNLAPTQTMKVDASTFSHGTGGVDSDFYDFVGGTAGFIVAPDLPLNNAANIAEDATKVVYYTPRAGGFQGGVSFTPDSGNGGTAAGFSTDANAGQFENVFDLGVNYTGQYDQVGIAASATGSFGSAEAAGQEDLEAYALGLNLSYLGFTAGGSYGDWQDSIANNVDASFWNVGLGYETGPFGASVSYFDSEAGTNEFSNLIVGADYKLAPGLVPYVEVNFFDLDAAGTLADNEGTAVLAGTQLTF